MILFEEILAVLIFGAVGAFLRLVASRWVSELMPRYFPWGILTVNIIGSFVMGLLTGLLLHKTGISPFWRAGLFIGLLGGFTTFSSFSLDTVTLFQAGETVRAAANIFVTLLGCLGATLVGLLLAKAFG
jgi:CrcB protein